MNSFDHVDPSLIDVFPTEHDGYPEEFEAMDTVESLRAVGARDFPDEWWIDPNDWDDAARDCDKYHTWPEDYRNRFTNQSGTHECTCHSLTQQFEIAYNAQRHGAGTAIFVSPLSIYSEANPRIRGGANIQTVLSICQRRGFLPEYHGPDGPNTQRGKYRHTIVGTQGKGNDQNSGGDWVRLSNFPDGWTDTGRHLRALKCINIDRWEQMVCIVLRSRAVGVGRKGHAVPLTKWMAADQVMQYTDSYDRHLYDSITTMKRSVGGAHAIVTTCNPDDWDFPVADELI